jgi:serine/threonine protein kinase
MLVANEAIFKLCDFGICGTLKDSVSSTHLGSMRYLPVCFRQLIYIFNLDLFIKPERLGNVCSYGTRSDMWALGMSLVYKFTHIFHLKSYLNLVRSESRLSSTCFRIYNVIYVNLNYLQHFIKKLNILFHFCKIKENILFWKFFLFKKDFVMM